MAEQIIEKLSQLFAEEKPVSTWLQTLFPADKRDALVEWLDYVQDTGREAIYDALNAQARADIAEQARARSSLAAFFTACADAVCSSSKCGDGSREKYVHLRISELAASLEREAHAIIRSAVVAPFMQREGETAQTCHETYGPDGGLSVPEVEGTGTVALPEVCIRLPARISWAGGWTDTPPYCLERGGIIIHMAVELDGRLPVSATARLIPRPALELVSSDLGHRRRVETLDELRSYTEPATDPFALHKAVLSFFFWRWVGAPTGSAARPGAGTAAALAEALEEWCGAGRGLELATEVYLPKGSGLGTSSILALACLRALKRLFGPAAGPAAAAGPGLLGTSGASGRVYARREQRADLDDEFNAILAIEQMLTTGGGWNDQIGGAFPGIRRVDSERGVRQSYTMTHLALSPHHRRRFDDKLVVAYTGQQRLAKTVLSRVVANWVLRNDGMRGKMERLHVLAERFFGLLEKFAALAPETVEGCPEAADPIFDDMGRCVLEIREANVALEETWTNENVDALFAALEPLVSGSYLVGAGSGGFVVGFLRAGVTREQAAAVLRARRPQAELANVRLYDP